MKSERRPFPARLYGALLRFLPPRIHREDGAEMSTAFEDLWRGTAPADRVGVAFRSFGRLPAVIVMEWLDVLGITKRRGGGDMGGWTRHFRYAVRTLRKAPAFTVSTVLLVALGVGAVTTIFTLVDHVLLRPLPYPAADRLVTVQNGSHSGLSFREFQQIDGVEAWVAGYSQDVILTGDVEPVRLEQASVTEDFFSFFAARPQVGRLLAADDFVGLDAVVLAGPVWERLFGSDPDIVGRTIRIDDTAVTVVGVLDDGFEIPQHVLPANTELFRPIDWSDPVMGDPGYHMLEVAGRLAPGMTMALLQERLDAISARLGRAHEEMRDQDGTPDPMPAAGLQDATVQQVRTGLGLLLGAVALLLLVACLNVAHLFLARGLGRVREMAVRRALGAGHSGLVRQLLAESLTVGIAGGLLGLGLAQLALRALLAVNPYALPRGAGITLDLRVALFAIAVSAATAVLFGLVPAMRTVHGELHEELKASTRGSTSGRGTRRLRGGLVVLEVAVSLVLVAQAGLLLKSFARVQAHQPGFDPAGVWTLPLTPTGLDDATAYVTAMDEVVASLAAVPGVEHAAYGLTLPFQYTGTARCCWRQGQLEVDGVVVESLRVMTHPVSTDYFETLRIPFVAGTAWTDASIDERPMPAVVTERLAIDVFGGAEAAIGHVVGSGDRAMRVVGVAEDVKHYGLDQPDQVGAYVPMSGLPFVVDRAHMAVRLAGDAPEAMPAALRDAVWSVAPTLPVPTVRPMSEWMSRSMSTRRFDSLLFGSFGVVALMLAAAGLYGTLLYTVRQQGRELGIRIALGAARSRVEREVVGRGLRLALAGAALGIGVAAWTGRLLESRLYEVGGADPFALGVSAAVLVVVAGVASWIPARRAGRVDPLEALRSE